MIDYKKVFKSRELRIQILRILRFVPDKTMVSFQYKIKTGNKLSLKNPKRYTEKMQWYKLYYRDNNMVKCTDKYDVRTFVEDRKLKHILNECYGVFSNVEDIDFNKLPNRFVVKDTLGSASISVYVVKDKNKEDLNALKQKIKKWLENASHIKDEGREWVYFSITTRLLRPE